MQDRVLLAGALLKGMRVLFFIKSQTSVLLVFVFFCPYETFLNTLALGHRFSFRETVNEGEGGRNERRSGKGK